MVGTFISCDYNEKLTTDYSLDSRLCRPCESGAPFSFGFAEESCQLCKEFADQNENADPVQQYTFAEACGTVEPEPDPVDPDCPNPPCNEPEPDPVDPITPVDPVDPVEPVDPTEPDTDI